MSTNELGPIFKPCYVPGLPVFPKKPLVLVFVVMDLLLFQVTRVVFQPKSQTGDFVAQRAERAQRDHRSPKAAHSGVF